MSSELPVFKQGKLTIWGMEEKIKDQAAVIDSAEKELKNWFGDQGTYAETKNIL